MSVLQLCATKLKSSLIEVMALCLKRAKKEWAGKIQTDAGGNLTCKNMPGHGGDHRVHILVKLGAPGLRYCDFGMIKGKDNVWSLAVDPSGVDFNKEQLEKDMMKEMVRLYDEINAAENGSILSPIEAVGDNRAYTIETPPSSEEALLE